MPICRIKHKQLKSYVPDDAFPNTKYEVPKILLQLPLQKSNVIGAYFILKGSASHSPITCIIKVRLRG